RFPVKLLGRGQALYSSFSFGIGGTLGSLSSGYLWEYAGSLLTFLSSACIAMLAWFLLLTANRSMELPATGKALQ
ncbi:MAG: MFS transporter, partial [Gammaproteobacteria bacterium]